MLAKYRGQALIEFAITLPILILLSVGALEVGRMIYSGVVITNAAREGAYYLSNNPKATDVATHVIDEAQNSGVYWTSISVTSSNCCTRFQPVSVNVQACAQGFYILSMFSYGSSCSNNAILISRYVEMMVAK